MTKYAIIKLAGRQYKVNDGQTITVDRLQNKEGDTLNIKDVLLYCDGENVLIGTPVLSDIPVTGKVIKHLKGEKVDVYKYKSKVRYRKHTGFRAFLTEVLIEKVGKTAKKSEKIPQKETKETLTTKTKGIKAKKAV